MRRAKRKIIPHQDQDQDQDQGQGQDQDQDKDIGTDRELSFFQSGAEKELWKGVKIIGDAIV